MAYDFEVNIGNFRKAPDFYNHILQSLQKNHNRNDFINGINHSNIKTNKICTKRFGLDTEIDGSYIYGEISYESPIWQQQLQEYLNLK